MIITKWHSKLVRLEFTSFLHFVSESIILQTPLKLLKIANSTYKTMIKSWTNCNNYFAKLFNLGLIADCSDCTLWRVMIRLVMITTLKPCKTFVPYVKIQNLWPEFLTETYMPRITSPIAIFTFEKKTTKYLSKNFGMIFENSISPTFQSKFEN